MSGRSRGSIAHAAAFHRTAAAFRRARTRVWSARDAWVFAGRSPMSRDRACCGMRGRGLTGALALLDVQHRRRPQRLPVEIELERFAEMRRTQKRRHQWTRQRGMLSKPLARTPIAYTHAHVTLQVI